MREIHFLVTKSLEHLLQEAQELRRWDAHPVVVVDRDVPGRHDGGEVRQWPASLSWSWPQKIPVAPRTTFMSSSIPRCSSQWRKLPLCEDVSWAPLPRRSVEPQHRQCTQRITRKNQSWLSLSLWRSWREWGVSVWRKKLPDFYLQIYVNFSGEYSYTLPWRFQLLKKSNAQRICKPFKEPRNRLPSC